MTLPAGLPRKIIGPAALLVIAITASSPATVIGGGVPVTYANTGVLGVPLAFLVMALILVLSLNTYAAASQYVRHPAASYALTCQGLSRILGVGVGFVAVVSYNAIQISLYGAFGFFAGLQFGGPWWVWALIAWLLIAVMGRLRPLVSAWVLAILLLAQFAVLAGITLVGLSTAPDGITWAAFAPKSLAVDGVGDALNFTMAAFVGLEIAATFSEEAQPGAVRKATVAGVILTGLFYATASWSLTVATGPDSIVEAAQSPTFPFDLLGPLAPYAGMVFLAAILAAALAFHNTAARLHFALGRERVLPYRLANVNKHKTPITGSSAQSVLGLLGVAAAVQLGWDPVGQLFTWLSAFAAMGVLGLLVVCCVAAMRFFRQGHGRNEGVWTTFYLPAVGTLFGLIVLVAMMWNIDKLLHVDSGAPITYILPGIHLFLLLIGFAWGAILRSNPGRYRKLGRGTPHPLRDPDMSLKDIQIWHGRRRDVDDDAISSA